MKMLRSALLHRLFAASTATSTRNYSFSAFASPLPVYRPAAAAVFSPSSSSSSSSSTSAADLEAEEEDDFICVNPPTLSSSSHGKVASTLPTLLQPRVVIYDGVCHLCHRGVKWVSKVDKYAKIRFCCLQSKAAEPYLQLCGVDREDVLRRFLFIEGPEAYHEGSTAALKVASYLPLPYSALSAMLVVPAPLRDAVYDYVAKQRYDWFGKEDYCIIRKQDHELLDRFIDRDEIFSGGGDNHFF